jgi:Leucine-rich repeat (LRR) protein
LTNLTINNNKFTEQTLSIFSKFTNLERLDIGGNRFTGSLNYLRTLSKLKHLGIFYSGELETDLE